MSREIKYGTFLMTWVNFYLPEVWPKAEMVILARMVANLVGIYSAKPYGKFMYFPSV